MTPTVSGVPAGWLNHIGSAAVIGSPSIVTGGTGIFASATNGLLKSLLSSIWKL